MCSFVVFRLLLMVSLTAAPCAASSSFTIFLMVSKSSLSYSYILAVIKVSGVGVSLNRFFDLIDIFGIDLNFDKAFFEFTVVS